MLELKDICKTFNIGTVNQTTIFTDFNLNVKKGEFVSVVGSNGSGKTTMLNVICGSIPVDSGDVIIAGENVTKKPDYYRYKRIGRVYQDPAVGTCANMTVLENMSLADNKGKHWSLTAGTNKSKIEEYQYLLSTLGLGIEDKLYVKVGNLSGGQRQAMSLLMSTMTPIDFLILDEHTAALDPKTAETIMEITDRIVLEKNLTALMVTHNLRFAVEYGSRLIMMDEGKAIIDIAGEEKASNSVDDLLGTFYNISIEKGN